MSDTTTIDDGEDAIPPELEDINAAFWASFIRFAIKQEDFRKAFEAETGLVILPTPRNGIEAAIDLACGMDRQEVAARFVQWATETLWGIEYAPKKYRDELAARAK